jgi:hypothetical protein
MNRRVSAFVGAIICLFGFIWFLQGTGILPGSVMSGSQFWEIVGGLTFVVGLLIFAKSVKSHRSEK